MRHYDVDNPVQLIHSLSLSLFPLHSPEEKKPNLACHKCTTNEYTKHVERKGENPSCLLECLFIRAMSTTNFFTIESNHTKAILQKAGTIFGL